MIVQRSLILSINSTIIVFYCDSTVIGDFYCTKKVFILNLAKYNLTLVKVVHSCTLLYYDIQYAIRKVVIVILIIVLYVVIITYKR